MHQGYFSDNEDIFFFFWTLRFFYLQTNKTNKFKLALECVYETGSHKKDYIVTSVKTDTFSVLMARLSVKLIDELIRSER